MPAASAGETCEGDCGRSEGLCRLKLPPVVEECEEFRELTTEGGYHDEAEVSCGLSCAC